MKLSRYILSFLLLITMLCCKDTTSKIDKETIFFNRNDFQEQISLSHPDTIMTEALNPLFHYIIRDSLVLVSNKDDSQTFKCGLYSITGEMICEFAPKGSGPYEFVSASIKVDSNNTDTFHIEDAVQKKLWIYNIDSLISRKHTYQPSGINIPRSVINYCLYTDNTLVGYHFWYCDNEKYNNNIPPLAMYRYDQDTEIKSQKHEYKYFVANITGGLLFTDKKKREIWCANLYQDKIDIYNDSLKIIKSLSGPDQYNIKYAEVDEGTNMGIYFDRDNKYEAYRSYCLTDKHIYLLYLAIHDVPYKSNNLPPVEVFKLSWEGELLAVYKLNRYVYSISIDSEEKYLYGTSCNSYEDMPDFVKYKLNN